MAALFFMLAFMQPMVDPVGDLSGIYHVQGKENGKPYEAMAWVRDLGDGAYMVQYSGGGNNTIGIALRTGDSLSVGWTQDTGKGTLRGVTVYSIRGRVLSGRWVTLPGNAVVRETMTLLRPLEIE
jgi:hypothetical protein